MPFTVRDRTGWQLARISLATGETFRFPNIGEVVGAQYIPTGYLVYFQAGGLVVTPFDPKRAELAHAPVRILDSVYRMLGLGGSFFAVSQAGDLAYVSGHPDNTLVWVDRSGRETDIPRASGRFTSPRLSPDGTKVSLSDRRTILATVLDLRNGARTRLSRSSGISVWSPDGATIALSVEQPEVSNRDQLHLTSSDGNGSPEPLTPFENERWPSAWSRDGRYLTVHERHPETQRDILVFDFDSGSATPLLKTPDNERGAVFSPSGRWFVYVSNTSGRDEVYVRSFPDPETRLAVSTDGGVEPTWSRDGREIFYRRGRTMMVVLVNEGNELEIGEPAPLFDSDHDTGAAGLTNYDVSADGQRFIMLRGVGRPREIRVILNWLDELKREVPSS